MLTSDRIPNSNLNLSKFFMAKDFISFLLVLQKKTKTKYLNVKYNKNKCYQT